MEVQVFKEWVANPFSWVSIALLLAGFSWAMLRALATGLGAYAGKKGELRAMGEDIDKILTQVRESAYAAKKGEQIATSEDFKELLAQVRENTRVTEEVRTELAHEDWTEREWKGIRIKNLEQFMSYALEAMAVHVEYIYDLRQGNEKQRLNTSASLNARTLQNLFYPEVGPALDTFMDALVNGKTRAREFAKNYAKLDGVEREMAFAASVSEHEADVLAMQVSLQVFVEEVKRMSREIFNRHRVVAGGDDVRASP